MMATKDCDITGWSEHWHSPTVWRSSTFDILNWSKDMEVWVNSVWNKQGSALESVCWLFCVEYWSPITKVLRQRVCWLFCFKYWSPITKVVRQRVCWLFCFKYWSPITKVVRNLQDKTIKKFVHEKGFKSSGERTRLTEVLYSCFIYIAKFYLNIN